MTISRKRPLLASEKSLPAPKTLTTQRLEKILDGRKPKVKKTKKKVPTKKSIVAPPSNNRFGHLCNVEKSNSSRNNVLASRGGLASASKFRTSSKASTKPQRKSSLTTLKLGSALSKENNRRKGISAGKHQRSASLSRPTISGATESRSQSLFSKTIHRAPEEKDSKEESLQTVPTRVTKPTGKAQSLAENRYDDSVSKARTFSTKKTHGSSTSTPRQSERNNDDSTVLDAPIQGNEDSKSMDHPITVARDAPGVVPATESSPSTNMPSTMVLPTMKLNIGNKKRRRIAQAPNLQPTRRTVSEAAYKLPRVEELKLPPPSQHPRNDISSGHGNDPQKMDEEPDKSLQSKLQLAKNPTTLAIQPPPQQTTKRTKQPLVNNDNFVRQNLRNSAGACRGARNKKRFRGGRRFRRGDDEEERRKQQQEYFENKKYTTSQTAAQYTAKSTGLDPLDEFLDGAFHAKKSTPKGNLQAKTQDSTPVCVRHQRPCKLITVKKNTSGNKGRKFYACSMPRGEQCDHFQWAEDTIEAARAAVSKNSSHSSFIARQVTAHVNRFRPLTVPELRDELVKRNLDKNGKKQQLLMRLAIWTRDEIAKTCVEEQTAKSNSSEETSTTESNGEGPSNDSADEGGDGIILESDDSDDDSDDEDDSSASSSDLEVCLDEDDREVAKTESNEDDCFDEEEETTNKATRDASNDEPALDTPLAVLQTVFGLSNFREGQEWAIDRCLAQKKSILVAPTGFGKSLCYALPASMMDGVCVVVSPLISLIQDQLRSLPPRVPAATLSGSISTAAMAAIVDDVIRKRIKILFVSPERLTSASFRRLFRPRWNDETKEMERQFPDISLLCVDEAHCMSQWAHNFRPCFLRFKNLLSLMVPKSVLAITATAGPRVINDICDILDISGGYRQESEDIASESPEKTNECIKIINKSRDNIDVACQFVANHEERLSILARILKTKSQHPSANEKSCPFSGVMAKGSVIVYVWRQKDTEVVAEYLNSSGVNGGVVMYHGGMDATARSTAQSKFMRGKARICVATVAFGLGIDKADIEGIVHLYISNSPEHYLQEIGRAGRDGRYARALALPAVDEIPIRHSLAHSTLLSKSQIKSLLNALRHEINLILSKLPEGHDRVRPLFVGIPVQSSVIGCDCKVETLDTLLSLIEQKGGADPLLSVEGFNYDKATVAMKKRKLETLAEKEIVAKSILGVGNCLDPPLGESRDENPAEGQSSAPVSSFQRQFLAYSMGSYSFSVAHCAGHMGASAEPRHVFAALKRLQSMNELEFSLDTTDVGRVLYVRLSPRGLDFFASDGFETRAAALIDELHEALHSSSTSGAKKVLDMHLIMQEVAAACESSPATNLFQSSSKSPGLLRFQELVGEYFRKGFDERQESAQAQGFLPDSFSSINGQLLENDVFSVFRDLPCLAKQASDSWKSLTIGNSEVVDYTTLSIAKFLHGIDSPRAPVLVCRGHALFGKWKEVQFCKVLDKIRLLLASKPAVAA